MTLEEELVRKAKRILRENPEFLELYKKVGLHTRRDKRIHISICDLGPFDARTEQQGWDVVPGQEGAPAKQGAGMILG